MNCSYAVGMWSGFFFLALKPKDIYSLPTPNAPSPVHADITTRSRGTVMRRTRGRSSGRCPPVAAGSAVCLSSSGRTSTCAAYPGRQTTFERQCLNLSWLFIAPSLGDSALQSSVLWRAAYWDGMPGSGTALIELLPAAKSSRFWSTSACGMSHNCVPFLPWWQKTYGTRILSYWLTIESAVWSGSLYVYGTVLMSEHLKSVKSQHSVFLYCYNDVMYLLGCD